MNKNTRMIQHRPYIPDSDVNTSVMETDIDAELPNTIWVKRRMTFPLSFKKRNENLQIEVPAGTLAKQSVVKTIDAEEMYKCHPTQSQAFHDNHSFSESYSYRPRPTSLYSEDELQHPFAKSKRFI